MVKEESAKKEVKEKSKKGEWTRETFLMHMLGRDESGNNSGERKEKH